ncbi:tetratricopeptide repeat protein [Paludibaculum fermentans]|uniref:tetratricopeptide repeat protein n=1 Tax=Paludibaculum fermentans TaxID=1473598 RepID=UPI003EBCFF29
MLWLRGVILAIVGLAVSAETFEVRGQLVPAVRASVSLHGATSPFQASTLSDSSGQFKFTRIEAGSYSLIIFVPGSGETRKTIDIGPRVAGKGRRVELAVRLDEAKMTPDRSAVVSMRELSIPDSARAEYVAADRRLGQRDVDGAIAHLKRAVEIAPQFASAWNHLGTIAYQTRRYDEAEGYFRKSLEADPQAYEPLVNLGGVLVTLGRMTEAWSFNLNAVLRRPNDALAQSQMGMTYFGLGKLELAERYLLEARRLDGGHFSHPQLLLAEIYLRRDEKQKAAEQLEDFLRHHPDWPQGEEMKRGISRLRGSPGA